ncbi:MAG: hypothetical protein B7Y39_14155 [Bdellovibrio sp. 28-41-41]|nr:MAG: hypothetical protein B7Y39_14155 [Bdellovibrio sp. 28-41-41]
MIFSRNKVKSLLGFVFSAGLLISCSENNEPQVKGANNSTFYVDALTAKYTTVGEPNAQGKQSKKLISFEACLKDNAQTNSVSNLKFDIVAGEAAATKVSDYRGCLVWYELVDFDPDAEVKNIFMTRDVKATESHSGTEQLVFWVNPHKDTFEFNRHGSAGGSVAASSVSYKLSRDVKTSSIAGYEYDIYVKINEDVNSLLSPIRRQAEITALRLDFRNIDYANIEVDSKMNLTFPYTYKTSLAMDLIRQDLGNITAEKIKRGNFMFNLVFLKEMAKVDKPSVSDVVAAVQWTARPRGDAGLIEVPISVKFSNIAALSSRMNVLLTITSLDSPALFADQSYDGIVNSISANDNLDISLIQNENSARELLEKYEVEKAQKPVRNLSAKQVLASEGFESVSAAAVKFTSRAGIFSKATESTVDLAKVIDNLGENQQLTDIEEKAVCAAFFLGKMQGNEAAYKDCLSNPNRVLNAEIREFANSVEGKPSNISFGRTENLKISAAFELTQGSAKTSGYNLDANIGGNIDAGVTAGIGGVLPIPKAPIKGDVGIGVKIGLGGKAYTAKALEKSEKGAKAVSISSTEAVSSQPIAVTLDLTATKCLLVVANASYTAKSAAIPKAKYLCSKNALKGQRTEYFFLLNHQRVDGNSSVTDTYSAVVNPLRMLVRGQRPYEFLKGILTSDKFSYKLLVGMNADQVTEDPTNFVTQEAPMMLSSTRKVVLGKSVK